MNSSDVVYLFFTLTLSGVMTYGVYGALRFGVIYFPGKQTLSQVSYTEKPVLFLLAFLGELVIGVVGWTAVYHAVQRLFFP